MLTVMYPEGFRNHYTNLGAQTRTKNFLVLYILSGIHRGKIFCKYARSSQVKEAYDCMLKFSSNSKLGKIFEKRCWISFITGCGGYILIKSKWFQSTKSFKLLGSFPPGPSPGLCRGPIVGSPTLQKKTLLKLLWIHQWDIYS